MSDPIVELNHYQQLMLRLSASSPYNAIHTVVLNSSTESVSLLKDSINAVVKQLAIGKPLISSDYQQVSFTPLIEAVPLETRVTTLDEHIENEMNYCFTSNEFPLRFFLVCDQEQHYFSITYNHWIADGFAIRRLMESIFNHLQEKTVFPITLNAPNPEDCFQHIYQNKIWYYRTLGVIQSFFRFSPAFRTAIRDEECTDTGCCTYFFDKEVFQQLAKRCKAQNITFNDLFMAVLAQLFGRITQGKREAIKAKFLKPKRDRIVIGVIANIRGPSQFPLLNTFGLFLGFFYLSFKSPECLSIEILSKQINAKTKRIKNQFTAIKQYLLFKVQTKIWDSRASKQKKYRIFSKNTPITVGISNMNLNQNEGALLGNVSQYIRFSPTAMVCPMVFNFTTYNGYLSLAINFRKACYTEVEAENIKREFVSELSKLV